MSADELELTFIRCSNCKSLMPSAAEKCGMCGFQRSEESTSKSRQRLRQQSDLNIAESAISPNQVLNPKNEEAEEEKENFRFKFAKPANEPKREYLNLTPQKAPEKTETDNWKKAGDQDFDEDFQEEESDEFEENFEDSSDRDDSNEQPREDFSTDGAEDRPKKKRRRRKKKPRNSSVDQTAEFSPSEKFVSPESYHEDKTRAVTEDQAVSNDVDFQEPEIQQRRFLDDHSRISDETKERNMPESNKKNNEQFRQEPQRFEPRRNEETRHEKFRNDSHRSEPVRAESFKNEFKEPVRFDNQKPETKRYDDPKTDDLSPSQPIAPKEKVEGKLLGWLVNYSMNGKGVSFELRSGRRFVGRQSLRQDDLVIPDSALSTPHCLLQVEDDQIFIQDLMSENGTFVKISSSHEFVRKEASVKINHGDSIKFGSYELIVCLVPRK